MRNTRFLIIPAILFFLTAPAYALQVPAPLVDANWLKKNQKQVRVLSIRADLKNIKQQAVYKTSKKTGKKKLLRVGGMIPGASLINYKKIRGKQKINGLTVKKMLPNQQTFEKMMRSAGINKNDAIIISSKGQKNGDMLLATRLYWQLKVYGHDNLAILDGGLAAWILAGNKASNQPAKNKTGNWSAKISDQHDLASSEDVEKAINSSTQLIDNRSLGQYLGSWKKSYVYNDGHIPGAKFFPTELMTTASLPARFNSTKKLRTLYKTMGLDPAQPSISYCNSGLLATGSWFVLSELLGNQHASMYDGSMHQWTLEKRPVKSLLME